MALPPNIPTSFVPHTPSSSRVLAGNLSNIFGYIGYGILLFTVVTALGVFFYGRVLANTKAADDTALANAQAAIDPATVESFLQLHNRLNSAQTLLNSHTAFSRFFEAIGTTMPKTVRLSTLHISLDTTGATGVEGTGVAKSFNALSAASEAFAADGRIKDVIFSKMTINKDNSVSFELSAKLDPSIIAYVPAAVPVAPAANTSATSTNL